MSKKTIKIGILLLTLSFFLGGCSFSFPWEESREPESIDNVIEQDNKKDSTDKPSGDAETEYERLTGELRKFMGVGALNTFITRFKAPASSLDFLSNESGYGPGSEINAKDLISSPINLSTPDLIKTKDDYAYSIVRKKINITRMYPGEGATNLGSIDFSSTPLEMAVSSDRLVVVGSDNQMGEGSLSASPQTSNYYFLKIYDISNPESPQEIRSLSFEGNYVGLRLVGNYVYFFNSNPVSYDEGTSTLPKIVDGGEILSASCSLNSKCLTDNIYYFDHDYESYNALSLSSVSLTDPTLNINRQSYLIDSNYKLYFSDSEFYLGREESLAKIDLEQEIKKEKLFNELSDEDREKIENIEKSAPFVLSPNEKRQKIGLIIDEYFSSLTDEEKESWQEEIDNSLNTKAKEMSNYLGNTDIYKFSLGSGKSQYQAKGRVGGRLIIGNSFDKDGDYLRLITVRGELWSLLFEGEKKSYSNIHILDNSLQEVGVLKNISTDSDISKSIFMKDRAYLTTTDDSDPVYILGLEDNSKPTILGAIQIGSYAYIYPGDEKGEKIIAIGRDASTGDEDEDNGLKLTLFDLSNLQEPKELSSYVIGDSYSDSIALSDYKSLANILDKKTIILPAAFSDSGNLVFSGVLVFKFDEEGSLSLQHRIDHSAQGNFSNSQNFRGFDYYDNTVKRSLVKGNNLFTFSNKYLKIHNLEEGTELKTVILTPSLEDDLINSDQEEPEEDLVSEEARDRDARRLSDVKQFQTALELYYNAEGRYPESLSVGDSIEDTSSNIYLAVIPTPPTPIDGDNCPNPQPEYTYTYTDTEDGGEYTIEYCLGEDYNNVEGNILQMANPGGIK